MSEVQGLQPQRWYCAGEGYSTEDLKEVFLRQGMAFTSEAITNLPSLCARLLRVPKEKILSDASRQLLLKQILQSGKRGRFPELFRLKRQRRFFRRLDRAVQMGRLSFTHEEERHLLTELANLKAGKRALRAEVAELEELYALALSERGLWDTAQLYHGGIQLLRRIGWPGSVQPKLTVLRWNGASLVERELVDELGRHVEVTEWKPPQISATPRAKWQRWHSLDDAAEGLADELVQLGSEELARTVVLLPDQAAVRRSVSRALDERGIPLSDYRDPAFLRQNEAVKWAMLPLEIVAEQYERDKVIDYLRLSQPENWSEISREIAGRGIRRGLKSYRGGGLAGVYRELSQLERSFSGRFLLIELAQRHLTNLVKSLHRKPELFAQYPWVVSFFEGVWKEMSEDFERLGWGNKVAPVFYWVSLLRERIEENSPPNLRSKSVYGARVFRLGQLPPANVWDGRHSLKIFGFYAGWVMDQQLGDYWYTDRERELMAGETDVRTSAAFRRERISALKLWVDLAQTVNILDYRFDADGKEREELTAGLEVLKISTVKMEEMQAHPRWLVSYEAFRPVSPQLVKLPSLQSLGESSIRVTALDRYSRCGFQALASSRWKLWEQREPGADLWPEVKGQILHRAVELIEKEGLNSAEALARAWQEKSFKGLLQGRRIEEATRLKLLETLEVFVIKEREYRTHSGAVPISLEEAEGFETQWQGFTVRGVPDRIDRYGDELHVIDYKTSSALPTGADILSLKYRTQLLFYGAGAEKKFARRVAGLQYIQLNKKGSRNAGVMSKRCNGKGKLTQLRTNSKSLFEEEVGDLLAASRGWMSEQVSAYASGRFEARPTKGETECRNCMASDLCGRRRISQLAEEV